MVIFIQWACLHWKTVPSGLILQELEGMKKRGQIETKNETMHQHRLILHRTPYEQSTLKEASPRHLPLAVIRHPELALRLLLCSSNE